MTTGMSTYLFSFFDFMFNLCIGFCSNVNTNNVTDYFIGKFDKTLCICINVSLDHHIDPAITTMNESDTLVAKVSRLIYNCISQLINVYKVL